MAVSLNKNVLLILDGQISPWKCQNHSEYFEFLHISVAPSSSDKMIDGRDEQVQDNHPHKNERPLNRYWSIAILILIVMIYIDMHIDIDIDAE